MVSPSSSNEWWFLAQKFRYIENDQKFHITERRSEDVSGITVYVEIVSHSSFEYSLSFCPKHSISHDMGSNIDNLL